MNKKKLSDKQIAERLADTALVTRSLQSAIYKALLMHKRANNPICESRDGKVVWIEPKDIKVKE